MSEVWQFTNQLFMLDSQLPHQLGNRLYQITALLISRSWQARFEEEKKSIRNCQTWPAEYTVPLLNFRHCSEAELDLPGSARGPASCKWSIFEPKVILEQVFPNICYN